MLGRQSVTAKSLNTAVTSEMTNNCSNTDCRMLHANWHCTQYGTVLWTWLGPHRHARVDINFEVAHWSSHDQCKLKKLCKDLAHNWAVYVMYEFTEKQPIFWLARTVQLPLTNAHWMTLLVFTVSWAGAYSTASAKLCRQRAKMSLPATTRAFYPTSLHFERRQHAKQCCSLAAINVTVTPTWENITTVITVRACACAFGSRLDDQTRLASTLRSATAARSDGQSQPALARGIVVIRYAVRRSATKSPQIRTHRGHH